MMRYRNKLLVPLLLGLGIIATFMREVAIAFYYGSGRTVEIYKIAFAMPYAFFQSLGSILIGGLLPILLNIGPENIKVIEKKVYLFFAVLFFFMLATVDIQSKYLAPGFNSLDQQVLKVNLCICWLIMVFSALIFPKRLLLQAQGKNVLVSSTSLIFSVAFIPLLYWFHNDFLNINLALFSIFSVCIVYVFYSLSSSKTLETNSDILRLSKETSKSIYWVLFWAVIYVLILSFPRIIDRAYASEYGQSTIANLDYAMNFYVAIGVLIGTSFNILMAKKIATEYTASNNKIIWLGSLLGLPLVITVALVLVILPNVNFIIDITYHRGAFELKSIREVSIILYWLLISLPFMVGGMILSQVLAATNMFLLILIMLFKVLTKSVFYIILDTPDRLDLFGKTTAIMEGLGVFIMAYCILSLKSQIVR